MSPPTDPADSTATPSPPNRRRSLSRRTFVAAGGTAALASLAGCSTLADFLAEMALNDVNVFNGADRPVSGTIEIVDPDGETLLAETFDLEEEPERDEETDENNEGLAQYDDVWTDAGDYEVSVALDDPLDGSASGNAENDTAEGAGENGTADGSESPVGPNRTDTVTIADTDEEKLVVGIAQEEPADLISFHVIQDFSDLEEEFGQETE